MIRCLWYGIGGKTGVGIFTNVVTNHQQSEIQFRIAKSRRFPFDFSLVRNYKIKYDGTFWAKIFKNSILTPNFVKMYNETADIIHSNQYFIFGNNIPWVMSFDHLVPIPPFTGPSQEQNAKNIAFKYKNYPHLKLQFNFLRRILQNSSLLLAWSQRAKIIAEEWFPDSKNKIKVLYPGLKSISTPPVTNDIPRILFVGTNFEAKGGPTLLKAISNISHDFELIIVSRVQNKKYLEIINKDSRIKHFNYLKRENLFSKFYPKADIFVLPTTQEAFGLVFLEAMNFSIPVISSNIHAIPEIVQDSVSGFLVEPYDYFTLQEKIENLLADSKKRRKLGQKGKQIFEKKFNIETFFKKLKYIYKSVIN